MSERRARLVLMSSIYDNVFITTSVTAGDGFQLFANVLFLYTIWLSGLKYPVFLTRVHLRVYMRCSIWVYQRRRSLKLMRVSGNKEQRSPETWGSREKGDAISLTKFEIVYNSRLIAFSLILRIQRAGWHLTMQ